MCPMNQECKQLSTISPNCADQIIGGLISAVVDVEQDMDIATPKLRLNFGKSDCKMVANCSVSICLGLPICFSSCATSDN